MIVIIPLEKFHKWKYRSYDYILIVLFSYNDKTLFSLFHSEANNKAEFSVSDPSTPNFQFSKDPLYPQSSGEQSIDTSKPGADSSFELSQNGMNGADNVCDQNKTTNDESNNNNNNMKSAKKSKLSSEDEKSKDNIENSIMEDSNDFPLVYKKEDPNLKNGISDGLELKEYEKEKCPQGHE